MTIAMAIITNDIVTALHIVAFVLAGMGNPKAATSVMGNQSCLIVKYCGLLYSNIL